MARIKPFEYTAQLASNAADLGWGVGVGEWQPLPPWVEDEYFNQMTYEFVSTGGPTGRFEVTNAPYADVVAEIATPGSQSNVAGFPWSAGNVAVPKQEISPPPTAFRLVATVGTIEANARATG